MTTKVAIIREPGYPVGVPAPCYIGCPCGARPLAYQGEEVACACGVRYTENGYIIATRSPDEPERAILNGTVYEIIAEVSLGPLAQADQPDVKRLVTLHRPNGTREYMAKDFGDHRYVMLPR